VKVNTYEVRFRGDAPIVMGTVRVEAPDIDTAINTVRKWMPLATDIKKVEWLN
jgi:hypothetical protein